jgi:DNA-directed RNA polymerase specialized sigma24 family protein
VTWHQPMGSFDNPINPEYEQEARLIEQSRAGSERAFSALLARYQQPVFRLIFFLVGDEDEARDLTRVALKHALHRLPRVPAGFSIRPWLLRVAALVALDAVRARSESAEALVASLQLPPPAGPPAIVDADPPGGRQEFDVALQQLEDDPRGAIADAWDRLPLDIERELVRRLLATMPETDAEMLALGVVGQVPTRELAAMVGTSQRSIRRRIARALIMFQSEFLSVSALALPAAPAAKELPPAAFPASPVETARRGFNDVAERVRRGIQGVRQGFGSVEAQERLQSLRAEDVPTANLVGRDVRPANVSDEPTVIVPATPGETQPVPTVIIPPMPERAAPPDESATWNAWPVPEPPELAPTQQRPIDASNAQTVILPPGALVEQDKPEPPEKPEAALPPTMVRADEPALPALRVLPRYGPPPDDVATLENQPSPADVARADELVAGEAMTVPAPASEEAETRARARVDLPLPSFAAPDPIAGEAATGSALPDVIILPPPEAIEPEQGAETSPQAGQPEAGDVMESAPLAEEVSIQPEAATEAAPIEDEAAPERIAAAAAETGPEEISLAVLANAIDVAALEMPAPAVEEESLGSGEEPMAAATQDAPVAAEQPVPDAEACTESGDEASPVAEETASAPTVATPEPVVPPRSTAWVDPGDLAGLAPTAAFSSPEGIEEGQVIEPPAEGIAIVAPASPPEKPSGISPEESGMIDPGDLAGIVPLHERATRPRTSRAEEPAQAPDVPPPQTSRTITRPMPRLDRSVVDPPSEW